MTYGMIVRLVRTFGSAWGQIQPNGEPRTIFFNQTSLLLDKADFAELREGQVVEFDEEPDRVNGMHAVRITPGHLPPSLERQ